MAENKFDKEPQIIYNEINKDILEKLSKENENKVFQDEAQFNRALLNFYCEFLAEMQKFNSLLDETYNILSVCSADKLDNFLVTLNNNFIKEEKRQNTLAKARKSHQKAQKTTKNTK